MTTEHLCTMSPMMLPVDNNKHIIHSDTLQLHVTQ